MDSRLKITQVMGSLAVIEGTVRNTSRSLEFELAMTESISGPVGSVIEREVPLEEIESVDVTRRIFRKSKLEFTATSVSTFKSIPGAKGFKYSVLANAPHREVVSFARDVLFDIAKVQMDGLQRRIERNRAG